MLIVFYLLILSLALIPLFLLLVVMPIIGVVEGDLFLALLGPSFLLSLFSLKYLLSGHWLRIFRRNDDQ